MAGEKKNNYVTTKKDNKQPCGCAGPAFIESAKRNHYCALMQAGREPDMYKKYNVYFGQVSLQRHPPVGGWFLLFPPISEMFL